MTWTEQRINTLYRQLQLLFFHLVSQSQIPFWRSNSTNIARRFGAVRRQKDFRAVPWAFRALNFLFHHCREIMKGNFVVFLSVMFMVFLPVCEGTVRLKLINWTWQIQAEHNRPTNRIAHILFRDFFCISGQMTRVVCSEMDRNRPIACQNQEILDIQDTTFTSVQDFRPCTTNNLIPKIRNLPRECKRYRTPSNSVGRWVYRRWVCLLNWWDEGARLYWLIVVAPCRRKMWLKLSLCDVDVPLSVQWSFHGSPLRNMISGQLTQFWATSVLGGKAFSFNFFCKI